jgi:hypothetical protein
MKLSSTFCPEQVVDVTDEPIAKTTAKENSRPVADWQAKRTSPGGRNGQAPIARPSKTMTR